MKNANFRVWRHNFEDPKYSQMIESHQGVYTALHHCLGVAVHAYWSDCDNQPHPEQYVLMQYTGLDDTVGKEMFESDYVIAYGDSKKREIVFAEGMFCVDIDGEPVPLAWYMTGTDKILVLGNKFEIEKEIVIS